MCQRTLVPDLQGCVHWVGCGGGVAVGEDGALPPWPRRKRAGPGGRTRTDLADLETPHSHPQRPGLPACSSIRNGQRDHSGLEQLARPPPGVAGTPGKLTSAGAAIPPPLTGESTGQMGPLLQLVPQALSQEGPRRVDRGAASARALHWELFAAAFDELAAIRGARRAAPAAPPACGRGDRGAKRGVIWLRLSAELFVADGGARGCDGVGTWLGCLPPHPTSKEAWRAVPVQLGFEEGKFHKTDLIFE